MPIYDTSDDILITGTNGADVIHGYPETNPPPSSEVASGLYRPLFATAPQGDKDHLYVVSQGGTITVHDITNPQATSKVFIKIPDEIINNSTEAGLLGFTFHPQFATNGKCYVNYTERSSQEQVIVEYTIDLNDTNSPPASTSRKIMTIDYPDDTSHHRAGWIDFGPDGKLYIATGDGFEKEGTSQSNADAAQTLTNTDRSINHLGKILRIDVNGDDFPEDPDRNYSIPDGSDGTPANPTDFQGVAEDLQVPSEIWAIGLRNPWRASFGPDGKLYVADVGQNSYEEVNIVEAGKNYGWRVAPGADGPQNSPNYSDPYFFYGRNPEDPINGRSVTGGYFYTGDGELKGKYIFGDFVAGKIFAMDVSGATGQAEEITHLFRDAQGSQIDFGALASFGRDGQGNLYAVSYGNGFGLTGKVFRLSDSTPVTDGPDSIEAGGGNDVVYAGAGNDTIHGGDDNDHLYGEADDDHLYGDTGADILEGGAGKDTYYVDGDDTVVESSANADLDAVITSASFTLDAGVAVEILQTNSLSSKTALDLTGNGYDQQIFGNAGSNRLVGGGGKDTLAGFDGDDTYVIDSSDDEIHFVAERATGGKDTIESYVDFSLNAEEPNSVYHHIENLTLLGSATKGTGNAGDNHITGNGIANILDGAGGKDTLAGGDGNDTYYVDSDDDSIVEANGMGTDTIIVSGGSYVLADDVHVEIIKADTNNDWGDLTGNNLANIFHGNKGANLIDGRGGNDTIVLSGNRTSYTITRNQDGSFSLAGNGSGTDTIRNVEIFQFADGAVSAENLLNPAPTGISLDKDVVAENSSNLAFGQFTVTDNPGDTHTFELTDNAGGRFSVDRQSGRLSVADGVRLDYEQATEHSITVKVTDSAGVSISRTLAIKVADILNENAVGSTASDRILGGSGADAFSGGGGDDTLSAGAGHDRLNGDVGNDSLEGDAGNDVFNGGDGNDRLVGGLGKDMFTGGKGRDVFVFDDKETGSSKTKADYITDFKGREGDKIDLRAVDANTKKSGDQNFSFIGTKAFSKEGQVRYEKAKGYTYVYLNTDSDKAAEAVIKLKGAMDLSKGWFVL